MLHTLDAPAVRSWCRLALRALGQAREEIDALNVYPVPDGDTGTNLYLTVESAAAEVESRFADPGRARHRTSPRPPGRWPAARWSAPAATPA